MSLRVLSFARRVRRPLGCTVPPPDQRSMLEQFMNDLQVLVWNRPRAFSALARAAHLLAEKVRRQLPSA